MVRKAIGVLKQEIKFPKENEFFRRLNSEIKKYLKFSVLIEARREAIAGTGFAETLAGLEKYGD